MALLKQRTCRFINSTFRLYLSSNGSHSFPLRTRTHELVNSDLSINAKLQQNETFPAKEWQSIRQELLESSYEITEKVVDATLIDVCQYYKNNVAAHDYLKFLKQTTPNLSLFVSGMYIKSFALLNRPITKSEEKDIIETYDNIKKMHPVLDPTSAMNCILGLCLTDRWQESEALLEMTEICGLFKNSAAYSLIATAFDHDKPEIGWKYLFKFIKFNALDKVYTSYLEYCKRNFRDIQQFDEEVAKMFTFWKTYQILPCKDVVNMYVAAYQEFGWFSNYTTVNRNGLCINCWHSLKAVELTGPEFKLLSDKMLNKVILGQNVYFKSTPQEVQNYLNFIKKTNPYNVVVDGLNVAYFMKKKAGLSPVSLLIHVVRYFTKLKKNVLVIGRKHMNHWPKDHMATLRSLSTVYLVNDLSQDDPFLLYAVLNGGPNTYFVSRDMMRQHWFELNDQTVQRLFKKWQSSRQYIVTLNDRKQVTIQPPLLHSQHSQKDENGWHIPYYVQKTRYSDEHAEPHTETWLCLRKTQINKNNSKDKFYQELQKVATSKI